MAAAIDRLTNIGGPGEDRRRVYVSMVMSDPVWGVDMGADCNWGLAPVSYGEAPATASTQSNNSLSHRLPRGCGHLGEIDAI